MPLLKIDIIVGAVAYLDSARLIADDRIIITGPEVPLNDGTRGAMPVPRNGPFICIDIDRDTATWVYLTTQHRDERLGIEGAWVTNGYGRLASGHNYLQDGANTYSGVLDAFVDAGNAEVPFNGGRRPHVSAAGVTAIKQEVARQQHRAAVYKR